MPSLLQGITVFCLNCTITHGGVGQTGINIPILTCAKDVSFLLLDESRIFYFLYSCLFYTNFDILLMACCAYAARTLITSHRVV